MPTSDSTFWMIEHGEARQETEAKSDYKIVRDFVIRAAEKMPKEGHRFKLTQEGCSFAKFIGHIADDQYAYCSAVKGESKFSHFAKTPPHSRGQ